MLLVSTLSFIFSLQRYNSKMSLVSLLSYSCLDFPHQSSLHGQQFYLLFWNDWECHQLHILPNHTMVLTKPNNLSILYPCPGMLASLGVTGSTPCAASPWLCISTWSFLTIGGSVWSRLRGTGRQEGDKICWKSQRNKDSFGCRSWIPFFKKYNCYHDCNFYWLYLM